MKCIWISFLLYTFYALIKKYNIIRKSYILKNVLVKISDEGELLFNFIVIFFKIFSVMSRLMNIKQYKKNPFKNFPSIF